MLKLSLNTNEREFQSQIVIWLSEINQNHNKVFESISAETTIKGLSFDIRFPDIVIWNNRVSNDAFIFLELKQPNIDLDTTEFKKMQKKNCKFKNKIFCFI